MYIPNIKHPIIFWPQIFRKLAAKPNPPIPGTRAVIPGCSNQLSEKDLTLTVQMMTHQRPQLKRSLHVHRASHQLFSASIIKYVSINMWGEGKTNKKCSLEKTKNHNREKKLLKIHVYLRFSKNSGNCRVVKMLGLKSKLAGDCLKEALFSYLPS